MVRSTPALTDITLSFSRTALGTQHTAFNLPERDAAGLFYRRAALGTIFQGWHVSQQPQRPELKSHDLPWHRVSGS